MPRKKNTIITKLIDAGSAESIEQSVAGMHGIATGLREFGKKVAPALTLNVRAKAVTPMIQELRRYPGKPHHPLRWKSQKQRRYVMMLLRATGQEDGYKRTFKLARGWQYSVTVDSDGSMTLRVWNEAEFHDPITGITTRYMPFVQGNIGLGTSDRSLQRYDAPIQPFHKDTGWNPAAPIIKKYTAIAKEESVRIYEFRLTNLVLKGKM